MLHEIRKVTKEKVGKSKEYLWQKESVQSKVIIKRKCFKESFRCKSAKFWESYKMNKETKNVLHEARMQTFDRLYQSLGTKE